MTKKSKVYDKNWALDVTRALLECYPRVSEFIIVVVDFPIMSHLAEILRNPKLRHLWVKYKEAIRLIEDGEIGCSFEDACISLVDSLCIETPNLANVKYFLGEKLKKKENFQPFLQDSLEFLQ